MKLYIVMAVRNGVDYTERAVSSLRSNEPFELIVIDNASTDGTGSYLAGLRIPPNRVRALTQSENIGVARAWNAGLRIALASRGHVDNRLCDKFRERVVPINQFQIGQRTLVSGGHHFNFIWTKGPCSNQPIDGDRLCLPYLATEPRFGTN